MLSGWNAYNTGYFIIMVTWASFGEKNPSNCKLRH